MKTILSSFFLLISTFAFCQVGEKNFIDQNYIEVTGKAEMEITPDLIYIKVLLSEKDTKNKVSVSELEKQMIQKLKEIGINIDKELMVKDIASNFKSYLLSKKEIILTKEYQVIVHDGKTASKMFIELEKIGISNVSIEKLDNSKMEQFRRDVKINAIKATKDKAEALTAAIGQGIGKAIYIQEIQNFYGYSQVSNNIMVRGVTSEYSTSESQPEIDFEKLHIEYSIMCRFELK
jgi:uncharacterized protein YggE